MDGSHCANKISSQFFLWFLYDVDYYYYSYITRSVETYISLPRQWKKNNRSMNKGERERPKVCNPLPVRSSLRKSKREGEYCISIIGTIDRDWLSDLLINSSSRFMLTCFDFWSPYNFTNICADHFLDRFR